jgi:hypothetical protein
MTAARTIRRGHFSVPGKRILLNGKTYQPGPMFVEWESPVEVTRHWPIVLMHGGSFQATEWFDTPTEAPVGPGGWWKRAMPSWLSIGQVMVLFRQYCQSTLRAWL